MATSKKKATQEQKEEYERVAHEKFNKILAAYRQIIDEISPTHFKLMDDIINKELKKGIDVQKSGSVFKEHLFEGIKKIFTKTWEDLQMKEKLMELEYCKNNLTCDKAWRPTNKSVEEQCDPHAIKALLKQREIFQRQIEFQNQQIAFLVPQIEDARKLMKGRTEKRNQLKIQMKRDTEKMKEAEAEIASELQKAYKIDL